MDLSIDGITYEAVQIVFRRAVIDYVRDQLSDTYPETWVAEVHTCFKTEEWDSIRASAAAAQELGYVDRAPQDDLDLLGVNNFYGLFEKHFTELMPEDELPAKEFVGKVRQSVLGWFREIKGVRDPISHPMSSELPLPDALRVIDSTIRVTRKLHLAEANLKLTAQFTELLESSSHLDHEKLGASRLDDTLPPRESVVDDFVGREQELASLWKWLSDDNSPRWLLTGDGGKGKTATAYKFASDVRLAAPSGLAGVFWLSAKRRRFDEGSIVEIDSPDFWDLDSALTKILVDYGWRSDVDKSLDAKRSIATQLFEELPSLLIVDDLDSIPPEEDDVVDFMTHTVPNCGFKVLLTSRREFIGMGKASTAVRGLDDEAAKEFLRSRASVMELPPDLLTDHRCVEIAHVCDGSPLYMEDLLRLCKFLPIDQALLDWKAHMGETVRRYAMEREIEMLTSEAREMLLACSIAAVPLSIDELVRITSMPQDAVMLAIDELRRMYLVPAAQLIEEVPRFAVNRNVATQVLSSMEGDPAVDSLGNAVIAVLGTGVSPGQAKAVGDYVRQARALSQGGRVSEAAQTLEAALDAFPNNARLLALLADVYTRLEPTRIADARLAWNRAYELGYSDSTAYIRWGKVELSEEQWVRAAEAAERGLERGSSKDLQLLQMAGYARSRCAQALQSSFNDDRANAEFALADRHLSRAVGTALKDGVNSYDASRAFRGWVLNAVFKGEQNAVCERLAKWLAFDPNDDYALREAKRQGRRCPEVQAQLLRQANDAPAG